MTALTVAKRGLQIVLFLSLTLSSLLSRADGYEVTENCEEFLLPSQFAKIKANYIPGGQSPLACIILEPVQKAENPPELLSKIQTIFDSYDMTPVEITTDSANQKQLSICKSFKAVNLYVVAEHRAFQQNCRTEFNPDTKKHKYNRCQFTNEPPTLQSNNCSFNRCPNNPLTPNTLSYKCAKVEKINFNTPEDLNKQKENISQEIEKYHLGLHSTVKEQVLNATQSPEFVYQIYQIVKQREEKKGL